MVSEAVANIFVLSHCMGSSEFSNWESDRPSNCPACNATLYRIRGHRRMTWVVIEYSREHLLSNRKYYVDVVPHLSPVLVLYRHEGNGVTIDTGSPSISL